MGGRPLDDEQLVERSKSGDADAYQELVRRYQGPAQRLAWLITRDDAGAEDVTQDAFVKAYYALDRFRSGSSFRPWLFRIVANEAKNRRRGRKRQESLVERLGPERASGGAVPSPEASALENEDREALLGAIERLTESDRTVIALRYFMDLSEAEMAAALGCAPGTVKSRLSRALGRLRKEMPVGDER